MRDFINEQGLLQLQSGHPWLFKKHLQKEVRLPATPCVMAVGEHWFFCCDREEIPLKRLGPFERGWPQGGKDRELVVRLDDFKQKFFGPLKELAKVSYERKSTLLGEKNFRWIYAENDYIPSLVVDLFQTENGEVHGVAVIQSLTTDWAWPVLKEILSEVLVEAGFTKNNIYWHEERKGKFSAELKGQQKESVGPEIESKIIEWKKLRWQVRPGVGQKTGAYFDQRDNHLKVADYAAKMKAQKIMDLCSFQGGHGLHLLAPEREVIFVDKSQEALDTLKKNIELNGLAHHPAQLICDDVFNYLRAVKEKMDLIILDPPSFAPHAGAKRDALRGLSELNLQAIKALRPGGLLVSYSCSHAVGVEDFQGMLARVSHNTRRELTLLEITGPAMDHATLVQFEEGQYLHGFFVLVR